MALILRKVDQNTVILEDKIEDAAKLPQHPYGRGLNDPWLWEVLGLAFVIRMAVIIDGPYIIHLDELYQYYEQAHRLAFGSGAVPWEFHDGARSWLIPGFLAAIMRITRLFGSDPIYYINAIRTFCAVLSLTVVLVGYKLTVRGAGRFGAVITGILCAVWIDPIYFSPSVLSEVLSSYCILGGVLLSDTKERGADHPLLLGVLLGLAVCLRVQMGPAAFVLAVMHCRAKWRESWLPLMAGGTAVVILDFGFLDWLTWGSPFHSVWHYLLRGVIEKFGGGYADRPGETIFVYAYLITRAWTPIALPLIVCIAIGAFRLPSLSIVLAVLVETHLLFANVEYRYLCGALIAAPILMGMGAVILCDKAKNLFSFDQRHRMTIRYALGTIVILYVALASYVASARGI